MTYRVASDPFGRFFINPRILPHVVDIYARADDRQDAGDRVPKDLASLAPLLRRASCWVQSAQPEEVIEWSRKNLVLSHTVTFFFDPGARNGDYIVFEGKTMVVKGVNNALEIHKVWIAMTRLVD